MIHTASKRFTTFLMAATAMASATIAAQAAPRQLVVVVAEGLSPQLMDMSALHVRYVEEQTTGEAGSPALGQLRLQGKSQAASAETLSSLRGLLKTAAQNGYKTGLVTTGKVSDAAGLFYDISGDANAVASTLVKSTKFDFVAGGGRGNFVASKIPGSLRADDFDASQELRTAGGTPILNAEVLEDTDLEIKGKTLVLQADESLSYSIDQNPEREGGFGEMATLAAQTLAGEDNAPYVLVVHDNLISKAIEAKDTPAVLEQTRTLDNVVADLITARESLDDPSTLGLALLATGGNMTPKFSTELASDRTNAIYVLSQLNLSYSGAAAALKDVNEEQLMEFATEQYKGWKLSDEIRSGLLNKSLDPEKAVRSSYEPAIAIGYETTAVAPTLLTLGVDVSGDAATALKNLVSKPVR